MKKKTHWDAPNKILLSGPDQEWQPDYWIPNDSQDLEKIEYEIIKESSGDYI